MLLGLGKVLGDDVRFAEIFVRALVLGIEP
jgi:hypothetical protein